jgi:two-component system, cell cycle sensor histidine kinase and response regulator CckA
MQRETILMVDDNRGFAKASLEDAGYSGMTAADGEEALRLYERHQSSIFLLFADVVTSNIDALDLANRVLQVDSQLPVPSISGYTWIVSRNLDCIAKPFRSIELVGRVNRALNATHTRTNDLRSEALAELHNFGRQVRS